MFCNSLLQANCCTIPLIFWLINHNTSKLFFSFSSQNLKTTVQNLSTKLFFAQGGVRRWRLTYEWRPKVKCNLSFIPWGCFNSTHSETTSQQIKSSATTNHHNIPVCMDYNLCAVILCEQTDPVSYVWTNSTYVGCLFTLYSSILYTLPNC